MANNSRVAGVKGASAPNKWDKLDPSERVGHIGHFIALTPSLTKSIAFIRHHMACYRVAPEGHVAFLVGDTRAGKTTAVTEVLTDLADELGGQIVKQTLPGGRGGAEAIVSVVVMTPQGIERPAVKIYVPFAPTFKAFLKDVLVAFDIKLPQSASFAECIVALGRQLHGQATRLIAFDDTHHVCEKGKRGPAYDASEVFKVLTKLAGVQVLCIGLEHTTEIIDANPQIEWSGSEVRVVEPMPITSDYNAPLATFCTTLNAELPFDEPSELDRPEVFVPLGVFCSGYEGRIALMIHLVTSYAISEGYRRLERKVFVDYLRERRRVPDEENVFLMTSDRLREWPAIMATAGRERLSRAEKRRTRGARTRSSFGARGR